MQNEKLEVIYPVMVFTLFLCCIIQTYRNSPFQNDGFVLVIYDTNGKNAAGERRGVTALLFFIFTSSLHFGSNEQLE